MNGASITVFFLLSVFSSYIHEVHGFVIQPHSSFLLTPSSTQLYAETKGFGPAKSKPEPRAKSSKQIQREKGAEKYDEISAKGGQEYNVFVRQFGADAKSWLPCGSVAVPRGAQVTDAIYANEKGLQEVGTYCFCMRTLCMNF